MSTDISNDITRIIVPAGDGMDVGADVEADVDRSLSDSETDGSKISDKNSSTATNVTLHDSVINAKGVTHRSTSAAIDAKGVATSAASEPTKVPANVPTKIPIHTTVHIDRNNTSFVLRLTEHFRQAKFSNAYSHLKYYQNLTREYVTNVSSGARGILAKYEMGFGKSMLAVALAIDLINERQPIILLSKSLQSNMRGAVHKYVRMRAENDQDFALGRLNTAQLDDWINANFSFVSLNASNMLTQMSRAAAGKATKELDAALEEQIGKLISQVTLEGKLLIVDEAHNLFRAIINGSKNAMGLYKMIMDTNDIKLVFLTGTPIYGDPFELVPCFNMLHGDTSHGPLLPTQYTDFYKLFVGPDGRITNKEKFQNRIMGLVSSIGAASTPGAGFGMSSVSSGEFPEEKPIIVERVPMDRQQYTYYMLARDKETEELSRGGPQRPAAAMNKPRGSRASTYRVRSRQLSNFLRTSEGVVIDSPKARAVADNLDKHKGQLNLIYSQFVGQGGLQSLAAYLHTRGWKPHKDVPPEFFAAEGVGTDVGISKDIEQSADNDISKDVERDTTTNAPADKAQSADNDISKDIEQDTTTDATDTAGASEPAMRTYAVIAGLVKPDVRQRIIDECNDPQNAHGGRIDAIFVSGAGAEGLDLKRFRVGHLLEPHWKWSRQRQIISRMARMDSHVDLPEDEKNVQTYIYLAVPPEGEPMGDTTDTELYADILRQANTITTFSAALDEVGIECMANNGASCRVCAPTDKPLFGDVFRDILAPDPCLLTAERKVHTAKSIEVTIGEETHKFYYEPSDASLFKYRVYYLDAQVNKHRAMREFDPRFMTVIEAIKKAENAA